MGSADQVDEKNQAPDAGERRMVVGLVTDAGLPAKAGNKVAGNLPSVLAAELDGGVTWQADVKTEPVLLDENGAIPAFAMADDYRERHGWDVMVIITDLPRGVGGQPIVGDYSTLHRVALASLPALGGGLGLTQRLRSLLVHLIGHLTEDRLRNGPHAIGHTLYAHQAGKLGELLAPTRHIPSAYTGVDGHIALTGLRGQWRLLRGMVHDNRPWRLLPHLASATAAAAGAAAFGIFYYTIWGMAEALPPWRLACINIVAIAAMVGWLIYYNHLWEHPVGPYRARRTILYNASTVLTLTISVICMYATLYVVSLLAAAAVIDSGYLQSKVGHPVGVGDYAALVWLASSMGIVAGALGSNLDGEDTVRQATYSRREQERQARRRSQAEAASQDKAT